MTSNSDLESWMTVAWRLQKYKFDGKAVVLRIAAIAIDL